MKARSSPDQNEMNICLKIVKTVQMKVKATDTIENLAENINHNEGLSEVNPKLFFDGKLLSNAQTIAGCGVPDHSTLHLFIDASSMQILVNFPSNNKTITLEVKENETVQDLKSTIQQKEGIQPSTFTLVFNGNLMEDERSLASTGVKNNSTVHLVYSTKEVISFSVAALGKEAVKLTVESAFSVRDVKAIAMSMLGKKSGDDPGLYYDGRRLVDSKSMAFYGVQDGSLLTLQSTRSFDKSAFIWKY